MADLHIILSIPKTKHNEAMYRIVGSGTNRHFTQSQLEGLVSSIQGFFFCDDHKDVESFEEYAKDLGKHMAEQWREQWREKAFIPKANSKGMIPKEKK